MILEPAIDLKDGKVVRLKKGDFDTVHQVADDPVAVAQAFAAAGAKVIHMVDLDGAKSGSRVNAAIVKEVAEQSGMKIEMGGGIRSMEDLKAVDAMGVWRMVIGSAAVTDPNFVKEAVRVYGDRIAVGCDALNGEVKTAGWVEGSGLDYVDFAKQMESFGVKTLIFTDIATDGMLSGPSFAALERLQKAVSCQIVASGGCGALEHFADVFTQADADAALAASLFHFGELTVPQVKDYLKTQDIPVR